MKKDRFYTLENIQEKARLLKDEAEKYTPPNNIRFNPEKSALLIIDMQNIFLMERYSAYIHSAPAILPVIKRLSKIFLTFQRPVIFTRHINTENNARMMSQWWNSIILEEYNSSQITTELDTSKGFVVKKPQYDAFIDSDLESILTDNDIAQMVICGVMTHLCCESTARSAFMKGFEVFFTVDGTATYNEQLHRGSIFNLAHGFAKPVLAEELISMMDTPNAGK
jgi:isochorismate hydrolase